MQTKRRKVASDGGILETKTAYLQAQPENSCLDRSTVVATTYLPSIFSYHKIKYGPLQIMKDSNFQSSANPWERVQLLGAPHNLQFLETPGAKAVVFSKALTTLTQDSSPDPEQTNNKTKPGRT